MCHAAMLDQSNQNVKHILHYAEYYVVMALQNRIRELIDENNLKPAGFAKQIGSSRATISDWLSGEITEISYKLAKSISARYGVNFDWIKEGKGDKFPPKLAIETGIYPEIETTSLIPLISFVSAGKWCEAIDNYSIGDAEEWMLCPGKHSKHTYALRVRGDSMTSQHGKSYPDGSIIYVDPEVPYTNGSRVIAKIPGCNEATFKQYAEDAGRRYLKPLNPQYPTIEIDDTTLICGVVIGQYIEG